MTSKGSEKSPNVRNYKKTPQILLPNPSDS